MKKLYSALIIASLMLAVLPMVMAVSVGSGITPNIVTEDFPPLVWMCDSRAVMDDNTEPGRIDGDEIFSQKIETCEYSFESCITQCVQEAESKCKTEPEGTECRVDEEDLACLTVCKENTVKITGDLDLNELDLGEIANELGLDLRKLKKFLEELDPCRVFKGYELDERHNNYAFEGEKIEWLVLVMDKNGIEKIEDVFATIGDSQGAGNDIEVNCLRLNGFSAPGERIKPSCNARILEERLDQFNPDTMSYYECTLTIETPESMYGEYWITVEAMDLDGLSGTMAENEYWFLNPVIALSIDGDMEFEDVRPGTESYSSTLLVGNDADDSSGVMLDMFISGTDFYDSSSSGAKCPYSNQLSLSAFRYFATNGASSTSDDMEIGRDDDVERDADDEGYVNIGYGIGFNNPHEFYDGYEIIQDDQAGGYYHANLLAPGAEMAITFKLSLPEPCNGDFDTGSIYFWGEAV